MIGRAAWPTVSVDLGVKHKDTFAVIAFNRGEWMDIYAGCAKGGQAIVPVMFRLAPPEITYIVCSLRVQGASSSKSPLWK